MPDGLPVKAVGVLLTGVHSQNHQSTPILVLEWDQMLGDELVAVGAGGGVEKDGMDHRFRGLPRDTLWKKEPQYPKKQQKFVH
jgi:hypothetical protein